MAPENVFPSVTQTGVYAAPARGTPYACSENKATENSVMVAMGCSKPTSMKANKHQKMMIHLAGSFVVRAAPKIARQTIQNSRLNHQRQAA